MERHNKRLGRRRVLALAGVVAAITVAAALVLPALAFDRSAEQLLERASWIRDQAWPGYQEAILAGLAPSEANGPYHRLDDLLSEAEVLLEPPTSPDDSLAGVLLPIEFDSGDVTVLSPRGELTVRLAEGALVATTGENQTEKTDRDYLINEQPIRIPVNEIGDIVIRARADVGNRMLFGWSKEPAAPSLRKLRGKLHLDLIADGSFHTYVIDARNALKRGLTQSDSLRWLYFTPSNAAGATVEIDYIRIVSKAAAYRAGIRGTGHEQVDGELRRVLYMVPDQILEYSLRVPDSEPRLDFGSAVLLDGSPVLFEVLIRDDGKTTSLFRERIASGAKWRDVRLSLAEWAGKDVALTLRANGSSSNVALWSSPIVSSSPSKRFNVIILLEDALRADRLETYGYGRSTAPAKDSLLRKSGLVFANAISSATKTRPSVPTLMTSLLPTATGVWWFSDALAEEYLTLAEVLRAQGFRTAAFVQNGNAGPYAGLHQGFDTVIDDQTLAPSTEGLFGSELSAWLHENRDRNFFLYLHVTDPHGEYDPPAPYDRWYREAGGGRTPVERSPAHDPEWVVEPTVEGRGELYDGEIRHNDAVIRTFLADLDSMGLIDPTLLVFTSDHGEFLGERGLWEHKPPGLRPVIHVPLMLHYPQRFAEPRRIMPTVQLADVMPTVLDLAGIDTTGMLLMGNSLVPLADSDPAGEWDERMVVSEEPTVMSKDAPCLCGSIFFRDWHLLFSRRLPGIDRQAYDFRSDPGEKRMALRPLPNLLLWSRGGGVIRDLQATNMETWRKMTGAGDAEVYRVEPGVLERLRGLGYIN